LNAEIYLLQIIASEQKIEDKMDEIKRLEALADNISPHLSEVKVKSTPNPHRAQEVWARIADMQNELLSDIDDLIDLKKEVKKTLEKLPPSEYDVLYRFYVIRQSIQLIATKTHYSRQTIYRIKQRGVEMIQKILDEDKR
jgi:DNA-directed RNA polymerase specialized sigma24 family protein